MPTRRLLLVLVSFAAAIAACFALGRFSAYLVHAVAIAAIAAMALNLLTGFCGQISFAQGAGTGVRTALGGGAGILRDDAGHDDYAAEMFAQGAAYYYALGLLWDRGGNDYYRAARYAQGSGVHQAVGVLRDDAGGDRYVLSVGVGQGMGLDLAVGILADMEGDDRYAAPTLAQGSATANGVGLMLDAGGEDEWRLSEHGEGWDFFLPRLAAYAPTVGVPS